MRRSRWREIAAPIIAEVISAVGDEDTKALRSALLAAYPFGQMALGKYGCPNCLGEGLRVDRPDDQTKVIQ
jgi:hypothetical protein